MAVLNEAGWLRGLSCSVKQLHKPRRRADRFPRDIRKRVRRPAVHYRRTGCGLCDPHVEPQPRAALERHASFDPEQIIMTRAAPEFEMRLHQR